MSKHFVDTHVHIVGIGRSFTDLQDKIKTVEDVINFNSRYPEIYQARLTEEPVDISDDLIQVMNRYSVSHAIIQQTPGTGTNDLVAETVKKHPSRLFGLLSFERGELKPGEKVKRRPGNWPSEEQLTRNRSQAAEDVAHGVEVLGLKGVGEFSLRKFTMETHPEKIVNDLAPFMDIIAKYKIPIQIATAWTQFPHALFYGDPIWADELAYSYPEVPIILTKMGRGILHLFENALSVAKRNTNVYFDILQSSGEHIRRAVDTIGAGRIMFGTDWSPTWRWLREPADRYTMQLNILNDANLSASEREQVEWRTAEEVFRLDL